MLRQPSSDDGSRPGEAIECLSQRRHACGALSRKPSHVGGVALSRSGDPGHWRLQRSEGDPEFGELADDLIARGDRIVLTSLREAQIRPDQEVADIGAV